MSYFLGVDSKISSISADRQFSTLLRESTAGLETTYLTTYSLTIPVGSEVVVNLGSIERLKLIAFRSTAEFDVSLSTDPLVDVWSGFESRYFLRVFEAGAIVELVKVKAATAATLECVLAGNAIV